ncbi:beta-galactosidase [Kamptonema cortianum]|nr:beta-galactosidase [Oscillatoria laete-virens]MDK3159921.1 beta-galactosidase [Kamptonema cortianum]MDL5050510.1 beta-galactosidase [Oscillatoria amoena NRMC-F 0135]MDL5055522.1 beta-galactosidase [Oscillatoria laete-virens NRMC-F 0139]
MKRVQVSTDCWNFEFAGSGDPVMPIGGNMINDEHPGQGTVFSHFDKDDIDRRLGLMAEAGLNCLRQALGVNQVFDRKSGLLPDGMKNWDIFIGLCEKHGIYLMPVGGYFGSNDWFDAEQLADDGEILDVSCRFWELFCAHYKDHPAIWAWDLRNELFYALNQHMVVEDEMNRKVTEKNLIDKWPLYLEGKYGSVDTMNRIYGTRYAGFDQAPYSIGFIEKPFDLCAADFRHYLNDRGYHWCKRQVEVIRQTAPGHMVVSGNNGTFFPDMDLILANGFHNHALHDLFDFISIHPYPAPQCLPTGHGDPLNGGEGARFWFNAVIGMARMDYFGKPVVLQEFGWYGGGESQFLSKLPHRSEQEHADYTRKLFDTLDGHANGFVNWPTFDMPKANDISNHGGIFTAEGRPKELAKTYAQLAEQKQGKRQKRKRGDVVLSFSLLGLYTCRSYQDQMWTRIDETLKNGKIPDIRFV